MRVKSIHLVTTSKILDTLLAIIKQVMSPKIAGRVHIHKTMDEISEFVPKHILPKDYGGEERSMKELYGTYASVYLGSNLQNLHNFSRLCWPL